MDQTSSPLPAKAGPVISRETAVRLLAALLLIVFLGQFIILADGRAWYAQVFDYLSPRLQSLRYAASLLLRIAGAAGAVGLFMFREWGRRLTVWLAVLSIATFYWKHPYPMVLRLTQDLDRKFGALLPDLSVVSFSSMAPLVWVAIWLPAVAISAGVLYFLTRPKTKSLFH